MIKDDVQYFKNGDVFYLAIEGKELDMIMRFFTS